MLLSPWDATLRDRLRSLDLVPKTTGDQQNLRRQTQSQIDMWFRNEPRWVQGGRHWGDWGVVVLVSASLSLFHSPLPPSFPSLLKSIFNTMARGRLFKPKSDYVTVLIRIHQWFPAWLSIKPKGLSSFHKACRILFFSNSLASTHTILLYFTPLIMTPSLSWTWQGYSCLKTFALIRLCAREALPWGIHI